MKLEKLGIFFIGLLVLVIASFFHYRFARDAYHRQEARHRDTVYDGGGRWFS